ncbi:MAG: alkaline phosphatase family protein [Candidatus Bipolaricaulia bacterium]
MNKVAVFGLDGATFSIIRPAVERGELPNLGALLESGVYGELESTIPPITAAAWTTFQTGVNPGEHGAFDWLVREPGSYRLRPISSTLIRQPRLWDYIGSQGGKVGIVGLPVTYPPQPVNGFLICGLLTPEGGRWTYPEGLAAELEASVGRFPFMPDHWPGRHQARRWLAGLKQGISQRERVAQYLLRRFDWDLFILHFIETDSVQHQMWHLCDGIARPAYWVEVEGEPILEIYHEVDRALGELLDELPSGTRVFVISDHGFGPLYWNLYINIWLLREGYLRLRRGPRTKLRLAALRLGLTQERLFPWGERLRLLGRGARLGYGELRELLGRFFLSFADVDWRRTRAYSHGNIGQIYLNKRGREPEGIVSEKEAEKLVEELSTGLRELRNPWNDGERVVERLYRKEELYHGGAIPQAPEIIFLPKRGYMVLGTTDFPANRIITPTFAGSGWHELKGVLIASGPGLGRGEVRGARLLDLPPTILYAMGLPVPTGLEGRPLAELFQAYREAQPMEYEPKAEPAAAEENDGEDWEEEARRRLRDLGYI